MYNLRHLNPVNNLYVLTRILYCILQCILNLDKMNTWLKHEFKTNTNRCFKA